MKDSQNERDNDKRPMAYAYNMGPAYVHMGYGHMDYVLCAYGPWPYCLWTIRTYGHIDYVLCAYGP